MRFLADENFDNRILEGVVREHPDFDVVRVQDTEIYQADDPTVLAWAAQEGRILLTRDVNTMVGFAYERVEAGFSDDFPFFGWNEAVRGVTLFDDRCHRLFAVS